jgi:hypothetical protein
MSGMPREKFAEQLQECFVSVWIDDLSGFGTFPIESMKCNTPVIGKMPRMLPDWMGTTDEQGNAQLKENGVWTANINSIPDIVSTMVGLFLEGGIPEHLTENMKETAKLYTMDELKTNVVNSYESLRARRENELETFLQLQLEKDAKAEGELVGTEGDNTTEQ